MLKEVGVWSLLSLFAKKGCKKMCKIFASEFGSKSGIMRGFQKGITLGGRTSRSVQKVYGGWGLGYLVSGSGYLVGWRNDNRVYESPKEFLIF